MYTRSGEEQVETKVTAQLFFVYHWLLLHIMSPFNPDLLWCVAFMMLCLGPLTHLKSDADTERSLFSYLNWNQCYPSSGCKNGFISSALFLPRSPLFSLLPRSYCQRSSYIPTSSEKPPWHFENPRAPIICTAHPAPHQKRRYNSSALCSGFLSYYLKNVDRILMVPWPSKVFKTLKLYS